MPDSFVRVVEGQSVIEQITPGDPTQVVSGTITYVGGTAVPGEEIEAVDQQIFVPAGGGTTTFTAFQTVDNGLFDADKTFDFRVDVTGVEPNGAVVPVNDLEHVTIANDHVPGFTVSLDNNGIIAADDPVGTVVGHITPTNIASDVQNDIQYSVVSPSPFVVVGSNIVTNALLAPTDPSTLTIEALYPPTGVKNDASAQWEVAGNPTTPVLPVEPPPDGPTIPPIEPPITPSNLGIQNALSFLPDAGKFAKEVLSGHVEPATATKVVLDASALTGVLLAGGAAALVTKDFVATGAAGVAGAGVGEAAGEQIAPALGQSIATDINNFLQKFTFTPVISGQ